MTVVLQVILIVVVAVVVEQQQGDEVILNNGKQILKGRLIVLEGPLLCMVIIMVDPS